MVKGGSAQSISIKHHSITCMKEYEGKSFEELRFEDYQANRKGPQQGSTGFGANAFGTTTTAQPSLFGQTDANKMAFGQTAFGQNTAFGQPAGQQTTTGFGAPAFGASTTATPSLFGQPDANKQPAFGQATPFGQTSTFGQTNTGAFGMGAQQNTTASPFGKPAAFGSTAPSTGFGFGSSAPQNANPFGANNAIKPFGATAQPQQQSFLFGGAQTTQPNTGFGTGLFANTQNTATGLFNKPAQPTTGFGATAQTPGFAFNTPASTQPSLFTNTSKPLFGGATNAAPAFGATNNNFGAANSTPFGSTFGKPAAPAFGQTQTSGIGSFGTGGLGNTTTTGLFGNTNQAKPGGLFNNSGTLFSTVPTTFQANAFGMGQPAQQQPLQLAQPEHHSLAQLTSDPFGDEPHLIGLEPKLRSHNLAMSATDPKELKTLLDASKKVDTAHSSKLKVTSLKNARDSLFDSHGQSSDYLRSPMANYQKTNVRKLILKPKASNDNTPNASSSNILDILLNEDKENQKSDSGNIGTVNPVRLTFDSTAHNESIANNSVETQTFNILHSTSRDVLTDRTWADEGRSSDDLEVTGDNKGAGDSVEKQYANIICTRPEYYTLPSLDQLVLDEDGQCFVEGFTIGRRGYGNVYFPDKIDVAGLHIDELVHLCYREVTIYPDDSKKPPVGEGLNRRAQVTIDNVYPKRTANNELIKDVGELTEMRFAEKLRKITEKKNGRFVDYRPETGSWVFKVDHFSKYGFNDSDEESEESSADALKKAELKKRQMALKAGQATGQAKQALDKEGKALDKETISREASQGSQEQHPTGTPSAKNISVEDLDEQQENDIFHHSMMMDDGSDDEYHPIPNFRPADMSFKPYIDTQHAKNIQLMKSTLFADDDRSDDAASHISFIKQYLDLQDVDEEIRNLPALPEETPIQPRLCVRPKIWKVLNNYQAPKASAEILPSRCCMDLGMFKGKSFKVGFTKGFNFYAPDNEECVRELLLQSVDASSRYDHLKDVLTDCLKVVLEESTFQLSASKVPTFKILKSDLYLKKQSAIFEKLASQYNSSEVDYLYSIWTLCAALWGPNENTIASRRYLLSEWLKSTCATDDLTLKAGPFKSVTEATESIFTHLSIFKVLDAAGIAMDAKLPNLSLLVAQLSLSNAPKSFIQEQVDIWYNSMAANHITPELKRLYLLVSGIPTKEDVNIFDGIDWKRAFGLHLWYICPNGAPIQTAIDLYKKAFEEYAYAERPNPPYTNSYSEEPFFDMIYHILLLYKSGIHRLSSTLNPATHTDDPLDYRLSWLLLQLFQSLNVGLIEVSEITKLCTSFSTQLEHLGLWEWAIFALLYLEDNSSKTNLIMGILNRNLSVEGDDLDEESRQIVDLLVNQMKIPAEWIHTVKGNKTLAFEKFYEAFNHFSLAEEYVTANEIFVDKLLSSLFINEQFDVIRNLTDKLKQGSRDILQWENEVGLILDYLNLLEESITAESLFNLQLKLSSLTERIVNFPTNTEQQKVCVAELSKRCASLYRELFVKSQSNPFKHSYTQFLESLIMPPDFKQIEGLFLIQDHYSNDR
ncbi:hypothetical protein D910_12711 [Dendroctonus ponderosae]|uniref:Nuclear pore complex protein Nup98-Nup96 n=1 Tax=Dendroctonus ponderosae TaxID=77166 RepID=U4UMY7_DENPD|nr:hypothetical protein D910_12711 [Dendroctonus ponderosae]